MLLKIRVAGKWLSLKPYTFERFVQAVDTKELQHHFQSKEIQEIKNLSLLKPRPPFRKILLGEVFYIEGMKVIVESALHPTSVLWRCKLSLILKISSNLILRESIKSFYGFASGQNWINRRGHKIKGRTDTDIWYLRGPRAFYELINRSTTAVIAG